MKTFLQIIKVSQDMRFVWAKIIAKYRISIIIVSESWDGEWEYSWAGQ